MFNKRGRNGPSLRSGTGGEPLVSFAVSEEGEGEGKGMVGGGLGLCLATGEKYVCPIPHVH